MSQQESKKNPANDLMSLTGYDQLKMGLESKQFKPSIGTTLEFDLIDVEKGKVTFRGNPSEKHMNPIGTIHGGYAATLLDSALGCAVHSTLEAGERYTTVDLNVKYIRAMMPGMGPVTCVGEIVHKGRKTATANATLVDENGKLLAHGNTTCIIL
ncbi:PaaI family thioesterase [Sneathiella glossodoripedis]|uniref:PaaI family thioesterase n=1 Tax=Sneathiella glossodoripedis TaxID=418853 RepID=UPI00055CAF9D|nr:PaaI family thioesterase [Sneathiella glossodoripedis]